MSDAPLDVIANGHVRLGLLGSFSLRVGTDVLRLPLNAQRLVCFLALHDGEVLREHVAGSLWSDVTERHAGGSLRSALWRLGNSAHPLIVVSDAHLGLAPEVLVDLRETQALARRILDESRELAEADMDEAALAKDLLSGWTEEWVLVKREHHRQLCLRALEALCRRLIALGRFGQATQSAMLAVYGEPLRESAQRLLIKAHLAERNVAAAVKQYESFRQFLREELGLEPSPEMRALMRSAGR